MIVLAGAVQASCYVIVRLVGQPVSVVAVAVAGGVGASGGVGNADADADDCDGRVLLSTLRAAVLPVVSMVRVLSLGAGGVTYRGWMLAVVVRVL